MVPRAALAAGLVFLVAGIVSARYGAHNPRPSMLAYTLDADRNEAKWAVFAARADAFSTQYVGNRPERGGSPHFYPDWLPGQFLLNSAPVLPLTAPSAALLDETPGPGGSRWLRLLVSSPRHARTLSVRAEDTEVLEAWIDRKKLGDPGEARWNAKKIWSVDYANVPPEGIELRLRVREGRPARLALVDRSSGLPEVPGRTFAPRPAETMPIHTGDQTMVLARFEF
jgi:hypothetical protein